MAATFLWQSPLFIDGLGERTEEALGRAGILTIADMLSRDPEEVRRATPSASKRMVESWVAAASLLQVDGVEPTLARTFVEGGIESVEELANADLQRVETIVKQATGPGSRRVASIYELAAMQRHAGRLRNTGMFGGKVVDAISGAALVGAVVEAADISAKTGADGVFGLQGLPAGLTLVTIEAVDRPIYSTRVPIRAGTLGRLKTFRLRIPEKALPPAKTFKESLGHLLVLRKGSRSRVESCALADLPNDTYLLVRAFSASGSARLVHLYRTQVGSAILIDLVNVEKRSLPDQTAVGEILHYKNSQLTRTPLTLRDIATKKLEAVIGPLASKLKRAAPTLRRRG